MSIHTSQHPQLTTVLENFARARFYCCMSLLTAPSAFAFLVVPYTSLYLTPHILKYHTHPPAMCGVILFTNSKWQTKQYLPPPPHRTAPHRTAPHHVLRPFFWDHPAEPVPEENFSTLVQGKINGGRHTDHPAGRHSSRTNQCPPPPSSHIFYGPDALPATQPTVSKH